MQISDAGNGFKNDFYERLVHGVALTCSSVRFISQQVDLSVGLREMIP